MSFDCSGTGVALVTPFTKNHEVDFKALENVVKQTISGGIDYLVVMGTTGESVTLAKDEQKEILQAIREISNNSLPIVLGVGSNNTKAVLSALENTDCKDIAGILSVCPYYNKPSQEGIYLHYKALADASPVPIILYNVPGRTGLNISAQTTLRLAEHKNILAMKEASGDLSQIMEIVRKRPEGFKVLSGDDALTLPMIALGADGVISVVANLLPAEFSQMVKLALDGKFEQARELHYKILPVINLLFKEGSPSGVKAGLYIKGLIENIVRLPLTPVSQGLEDELKKQLGLI